MKTIHTEACRLGRERCSRQCKTVYEGSKVQLILKNPDGTETVINTFENVNYELTYHDTLAPIIDVYDGREESP
jgi:hypothetical protein